MERLQSVYVKRVIGATQTTSKLCVEGDTGLEKLSVRRDRLKLRYYGYLINLPSSRFVRKVLKMQEAELKVGRGKASWLAATHQLLLHYGLAEHRWADSVPARWKSLVDDAVMRTRAAEWLAELDTHPELSIYRMVVARPALRPYLRFPRERTRLKFALRTNGLPLNAVDTPMRSLEGEARLCPMCELDEEETVVHFLSRCTTLQRQREALLDDLMRSLDRFPSVAEKCVRDIVGMTDIEFACTVLRSEFVSWTESAQGRDVFVIWRCIERSMLRFVESCWLFRQRALLWRTASNNKACIAVLHRWC
jgi:hypothetical protein